MSQITFDSCFIEHESLNYKNFYNAGHTSDCVFVFPEGTNSLDSQKHYNSVITSSNLMISSNCDSTWLSEVNKFENISFEPEKWVSECLNVEPEVEENQLASSRSELNVKHSETDEIVFRFDDVTSPRGLDQSSNKSLTFEDTSSNVEALVEDELKKEVRSSHRHQSTEVSESHTEIKLKAKKRVHLHDRKDVVNKGSLRVIRKAFRHLYYSMFTHVRKRTIHGKLRQFDDFVSQLVSILNHQSEVLSDVNCKDSDYLIRKELVGRIIDSKLYDRFQSNQKSIQSVEIKEFVGLLNKCCTSYSHTLFNRLCEFRIFKTLIELYENLKAQGLLVQYGVIDQNNAHYVENVDQIKAFLTS